MKPLSFGSRRPIYRERKVNTLGYVPGFPERHATLLQFLRNFRAHALPFCIYFTVNRYE